MSSLKTQLPLFEKLKKANVKELIVLSISTYFVFSIISFFVLNFFLQVYLSGLLQSQNYSVSTQQWRTVINGLKAGWYEPEIKSLYIYKNNKLVAGSGPIVFNFAWSGMEVDSNYKSYHVVLNFKYSIWIIATILPFLGLVFVYLIYLSLKGPLLRKNYLKILGDIERVFTIDQRDTRKLNDFETIIKEQANKIALLSKKAVVGDIARQVAHDIRSPLGAMDIVINSDSELTYEKKELLKSATKRINDIAQDLLSHKYINNENSNPNKEADEVNNSHFLERESVNDIITTTRNIVELKKTEYNSSNVEFKFYEDISSGSQIFCSLNNYSRLLSNIINNSFESIKKAGLVTVEISEDQRHLYLDIRDNGMGIDSDLINKVFETGFSHGKEKGNGLGLSHAKKCVEGWGGKLAIYSKSNKGTTVHIMLKKGP